MSSYVPKDLQEVVDKYGIDLDQRTREQLRRDALNAKFSAAPEAHQKVYSDLRYLFGDKTYDIYVAEVLWDLVEAIAAMSNSGEVA